MVSSLSLLSEFEYDGAVRAIAFQQQGDLIAASTVEIYVANSYFEIFREPHDEHVRAMVPFVFA